MTAKAIPFADVDIIEACPACGCKLFSMYIFEGHFHQSCHWCDWKPAAVRVVEEELTEEMLR